MGDLGIVTLWEVREALLSIGEVDLLEDFGQEGRTYNRYAFELAKLKNLVTNYAQVPVPKSPRNRNSTMVAGAGLGLPGTGNSAQFLNVGTEAGAKKFTKKKKFDLGGSVHGTHAFG